MTRMFSRRILVITAGLAVAGSLGIAIGRAQQSRTGLMASDAGRFVASLTPEQRQKGVLALNSEEWTRWHFIPVSMFERHGVRFEDMTSAQLDLAHTLMKDSLSSAGYMTATSIMELETTLGALEDAERAAAAQSGGRGPQVIPRDPLNYFVSVFGEPSATAQWGWRVEGHHVSLHFSVDGGKMAIASTPQFFDRIRRKCAKGRRRGCGSSARKKTRRARCSPRSTPRSGRPRSSRRRRRATSSR